MWVQQGRNWHFGKIEFSIDIEYTGNSTQFKIKFNSEVEVILLLWNNKQTETSKGREPNSAAALASEPATGHSASIIVIVLWPWAETY